MPGLPNLIDAHYQYADAERYVVLRQSNAYRFVVTVFCPHNFLLTRDDLIYIDSFMTERCAVAAFEAMCLRFEDEGYKLVERREGGMVV